MTQNILTETITRVVREYIDNIGSFAPDSQLSINPVTKVVNIASGREMLDEIENSNEAIEDAAGAEGAASEDATDFQARQNPDFYSLGALVKKDNKGHALPDQAKIAEIVKKYI